MSLLAVNPGLGSDANTYAQVSAGTHQWAHVERAHYGSTNREARVAAEAAQAGDIIEVEGGNTYSCQMSGDRLAPSLFNENSGISGAPIRYKAVNGDVTLEADVSDSGTATAVTATTLTDGGKAWTLGQWGTGSDYAVKITGSSGTPAAVGQIRWISNNNTVATRLDLTEAFATLPSGTITYEIIESGSMVGSYTGRDFIEYSIDDLSTSSWIINGNESPAHPDTGHVVFYDCDDCLAEGFDITCARSFYTDNINGIRIEGGTRIRIRNNLVTGARHTTSSSHNGAGIMAYSAISCTIENNEIDDSGCGINMKGESFGAGTQYGNTVRYNLIYNCRVGIRWDYSTGTSANSYCYQNVIRDNSDAGAGIGIDFGSDVRNLEVYNNTIDGITGEGINWASGVARTSLVVRDNLVTNTTTAINMGNIASIGTDSVNYDHVYIGTGTRFGTFNGSNKATRANFVASVAAETNGGDSDPLYDNLAGNVFTLQVGSPARTSSSTGGPVGAFITGTEVIGLDASDITSDPVTGSAPAVTALYLLAAARRPNNLRR
jgi:hypothetical protein